MKAQAADTGVRSTKQPASGLSWCAARAAHVSLERGYEMEPFTCVDLFSGAGGLSKGFLDAG